EHVFDALQLGLGFSFETQHQHRRGVGGANQTPALRVINANTVDAGQFGIAPLSVFFQRFNNGELGDVGDLDVDFRGRDVVREGFEQLFGGLRFLAEDFQQACSAVDAVV